MNRYRSFNQAMGERFGCKVYKLALDGGFTCPTRDGTLDTRGCIFCADGSGDFATPVGGDVYAAIEKAKERVADKGGKRFIAYFQSYTGTYAPVGRLRALYTGAITHPDVAALSVATRPDCLPDEVIALLAELNTLKPVWVELGLQTVHGETARYIRRGWALPVFDSAVKRLREAGLTLIVHMILGLPGETPEMMAETAQYIGKNGAQGVKFQLLHVPEGTDLAEDYRRGAFRTLTMDEYIDVLESCIESVPADMVIHRLTGDGAKKNLIAPLWSADKKRVLNEIGQRFELDDVQQGRRV